MLFHSCIHNLPKIVNPPPAEPATGSFLRMRSNIRKAEHLKVFKCSALWFNGKFHFFAGSGMTEAQTICTKCKNLTLCFRILFCLCTAIFPVAHNGHTGTGKLHTYLVMPSGQQLNIHKCQCFLHLTDLQTKSALSGILCTLRPLINDF